MTALKDIAAERQRQIEVEGWTIDHDDEHVSGQMAHAAACYIAGKPSIWPWSDEWWKPKSRRRNLVRAAALLVAEIERLDRQEKRHQRNPGEPEDMTLHQTDTYHYGCGNEPRVGDLIEFGTRHLRLLVVEISEDAPDIIIYAGRNFQFNEVHLSQTKLIARQGQPEDET